MKKLFLILIAVMLMFALVACGEKPNDNTPVQNNPPANNSVQNNTPTEAPVEVVATPEPAPVQTTTSEGIAPATDGTLTLSKANLAIVVNGTTVQRPYNLKALEAAGVPADESRSEIKLGAGDIFSVNLYLDEDEDYLVIPAYQNRGEEQISITEAEADEIAMTTYADEPVDQGVTILGVPFGMSINEVKALLGEPQTDDGSYLEWHLEIPDMAYEGTLSISTTEDAENAVVSEIKLSVIAK